MRIKTKDVRVGDKTMFGGEIIATERSGMKLIVQIRTKSGEVKVSEWALAGTVNLKDREPCPK